MAFLKGWEKPSTTKILAESQQLVHKLFNVHDVYQDICRSRTREYLNP